MRDAVVPMGLFAAATLVCIGRGYYKHQNPPPNPRRRVATRRQGDVMLQIELTLTEETIEIPTAKEMLLGYVGDIGAVSTFEGITRDFFENKRVTELEYEAYDKMALDVMEEIAWETTHKFDGVRKIIVIHKLGACPVGETSLFVSAMSAHRGPALEAIPFIVDELKRKVPIWKLEKYADGKDASWKQNAGWDPKALASHSLT